jgi:hypothetical protein
MAEVTTNPPYWSLYEGKSVPPPPRVKRRGVLLTIKI